jgi:spore coat protein U-like protein
MDFGSHLASDTNIAGTTQLNVNCTNGAPYNIGLTATSGAVGSRKMTGTLGGTVSYELYQNAGHSTAWGDTAGTDTKSGTGTGTSAAVTVYGLVASATGAVSDTYQDTVTATITY